MGTIPAYYLILTIFNVSTSYIKEIPMKDNASCEKAGAEWLKKQKRLNTWSHKLSYLCVNTEVKSN